MVTRELIEQDFIEAVQAYPKLLKVYEQGNYWHIEGSIDVFDDEGGYWDTYDVKILIPPTYPKDIPILLETGKKIIRHSDWHTSSEGVCCLATRAKIFYDLSDGISLKKWLDKFAHPFLANHQYRLRNHKYAHEEFSHGTKGIIEGWEKITGIKNSHTILEHLRWIIGYKTQSKNLPCFCGSGKKYKRCFERHQNMHQYNIPTTEIEKDIIEICKYTTGRMK